MREWERERERERKREREKERERERARERGRGKEVINIQFCTELSEVRSTVFGSYIQ